MNTLDDIKARAEKAEEYRRKYGNSETEAAGIIAAYLSEESSYDVPKLVSALEAVESITWDMHRQPGDESWGSRIRQTIEEALS